MKDTEVKHKELKEEHDVLHSMKELALKMNYEA